MKHQMDKTQIHKTIRSRRAVSPIIATLLLIAIAVIGGVMIYVFTQGFFGSSSISTSPSVDTITMTGYDMREIIVSGSDGITTHEGTIILHGDDAAVAGFNGKDNGEEGAIYIKNVAQKIYSIAKIEVNGKALTFVSDDTPAAGEWMIYTAETAVDDDVSTLPAISASVLAGQEATLVVTFDDTDPAPDGNAALSGRTIPVKITSASGSTFNFNVVIGTKA